MFFDGVGFRPDIVFAMGTTRFLVKFAVTLPLALAATAAMLRAAQPGASFGVRGWALALSPIILISAVLELLNSDPASIDRASLLEILSSSEEYRLG